MEALRSSMSSPFLNIGSFNVKENKLIDFRDEDLEVPVDEDLLRLHREKLLRLTRLGLCLRPRTLLEIYLSCLTRLLIKLPPECFATNLLIHGGKFVALESLEIDGSMTPSERPSIAVAHSNVQPFPHLEVLTLVEMTIDLRLAHLIRSVGRKVRRITIASENYTLLTSVLEILFELQLQRIMLLIKKYSEELADGLYLEKKFCTTKYLKPILNRFGKAFQIVEMSLPPLSLIHI